METQLLLPTQTQVLPPYNTKQLACAEARIEPGIFRSLPAELFLLMNDNPGIRRTDIHCTSLTQCAPDRWRDAGALCLSCPFGSRRRRSVAGTHRLLKSPDRDTGTILEL